MEMYSVLIETMSLKEMTVLNKLNLDLKHRAARKLDKSRFPVPGILAKEQIHLLEAKNYKIKIISDLEKVSIERALEVSETNRFTAREGVQKFEERRSTAYLNADEVETALLTLKQQFPSYVTLIDLPNRTHLNKTSHAVRIRGIDNGLKPGVFFTGSMHAREWGGADACVAFLLNILNTYQNKINLEYGQKTFYKEDVEKMLNNLDIIVFPDVNPDGKEYSQTVDIWWRKNRNPNGPVDINRNFDFLWSS